MTGVFEETNQFFNSFQVYRRQYLEYFQTCPNIQTVNNEVIRCYLQLLGDVCDLQRRICGEVNVWKQSQQNSIITGKIDNSCLIRIYHCNTIILKFYFQASLDLKKVCISTCWLLWLIVLF